LSFRSMLHVVMAHLGIKRVDVVTDDPMVQLVGWCRLSTVVSDGGHIVLWTSLFGLLELCDGTVCSKAKSAQKHNFTH